MLVPFFHVGLVTAVVAPEFGGRLFAQGILPWRIGVGEKGRYYFVSWSFEKQPQKYYGSVRWYKKRAERTYYHKYTGCKKVAVTPAGLVRGIEEKQNDPTWHRRLMKTDTIEWHAHQVFNSAVLGGLL